MPRGSFVRRERTKKVIKNFRNTPDLIQFYNFVYENGLRHEAFTILKSIVAIQNKKRSRKTLRKWQ